MQKPPSSHSPKILGEDILESYKKWVEVEVLRVRAKYKLGERIATSAVAMAVLGASVTSLKLMGKTVKDIIALIKGQEAS